MIWALVREQLRAQRRYLGWAALAVGTSHAVLDYVIPYVKEREAFGEPIAGPNAPTPHGVPRPVGPS